MRSESPPPQLFSWRCRFVVQVQLHSMSDAGSEKEQRGEVIQDVHAHGTCSCSFGCSLLSSDSAFEGLHRKFLVTVPCGPTRLRPGEQTSKKKNSSARGEARVARRLVTHDNLIPVIAHHTTFMQNVTPTSTGYSFRYFNYCSFSQAKQDTDLCGYSRSLDLNLAVMYVPSLQQQFRSVPGKVYGGDY